MKLLKHKIHIGHTLVCEEDVHYFKRFLDCAEEGMLYCNITDDEDDAIARIIEDCRALVGCK